MLWRIAAAVGGLGGLGSLLLPYAYVSTSIGDVEVQEGSYTLLELAALLEETGNDPTMVYALAGVVVFGSAVALVAAITFHHLASAGAFVQGGAAVLFWLGLQMEGAQTFFMGLGQVDASVEVGFYALVAAGVASLLGSVIGAVTERERGRDGDTTAEPPRRD